MSKTTTWRDGGVLLRDAGQPISGWPCPECGKAHPETRKPVFCFGGSRGGVSVVGCAATGTIWRVEQTGVQMRLAV